MQVMMNSYVDEILRIWSEEAKELAISMLDAAGHVIKWNKIAEGIIGYRADEIIGKHFSCLYSVKDRDDVKPADVLKKAETEGRFEVEGWRYRKDGRRFWAKVVVSALRDKDGNLLGFSKVTRDLTNRVETEAKEESLASFPQLNPCPILELDANGRVAFCNGAMKEILNNAGDGDGANSFLPKNMPEILQAIKQKKALQFTEKIELSGLTYEERIYLAPELDAIRIYVTDITARRLAEEGLRESKEKYRAMIEAFDGLIYICSADYRIEFSNENLIKRTGKNSVGEFCYKALHDRDSVCPWCVNERVFAGETVRWELQSPKDGRWYYVVNAPIRNADGSMSKQSMIMDITERKVAEEERNVTIEFLSLVNAGMGTKDLLSAASTFFQKRSGCEAVGIRLREGDDYSCIEPCGFPPETVRAENEPCLRDYDGKVFRVDSGNHFIECMCGKVICGRIDPTKPYFTSGGSFWTNSAAELLSHYNQTDGQARWRNRCNGEGYESVALIPLHLGQERLGLLHLNDRRKGLFSPEVIELWERLAGYLAVALAKCRSEDELRKVQEELRRSNDELEKRVAERTERLEITAEALRTSEERYSLAVQGSNDGIWDRDVITGEVYFSPRWKSMLGYEDDEFPNNSDEWKKRIHPDDYQMVMDAIVGYMEGRIPSYEAEYRLRHKDGSYRYILARGICLRDSHGAPNRFSGSHTDITDKKLAEDALRQSEKNFRQVVELSPVAIAKYSNKEDKFILVNRKFTEQFGYTLEDLADVGHWWPLAYPDEKYRKVIKAEWESKVKQAIRNKRPFEPMEAMVTCKDGSVRCIEFNFSWVGERNLVSLTDLTEIKRAHEVIEQSEKKYRRLFEESKDTIFISDLARRIFDINQAGVELFGYAKKELFSLDLEKLYCNRADREVLWQKMYRSGFVSDFEVEMKRKEGGKIVVLLSMSLIKDDAGQVLGYQGIIRDVTDRKQLERQLLQSQKMESVGILAGGVAHDFNNLLTAISGYGQILLERIPEDDELSLESIRNVLKASGRAAELTKGLLAFSRKQLISPKPVHIETLISDTGKLIQRIIGEDIEFSTSFSGENLQVKADPGQIEQVLMNLASNARDAMPHGGHLTITTRQVVVEEGSEKLYDLPSPGEYAQISLADTGTGIDKKTLESIFEPFYTTKEVGKGTGLGLAIVHGIIKQHNGSVLACSKPGKGTTFDIYLPLVKGYIVKEESKISAVHTGGMETLLVVEDDETVRMFIKKILERAGYKVIIADNGEDAVARFRENDDISLVLSDLVMPKKNGREMRDEIRKIKAGIKVVFISGYAADVMQKKGMFEECMEFITKPFAKNDLLQKVREVLDKT